MNYLQEKALKSVSSNFTLAVHSPKFGQAKTHFLSHYGGGGNKKNMARLGWDSNPEAHRANHYSIGSLLENWQI